LIPTHYQGANLEASLKRLNKLVLETAGKARRIAGIGNSKYASKSLSRPGSKVLFAGFVDSPRPQ
jgi:hypothetical protein